MNGRKDGMWREREHGGGEGTWSGVGIRADICGRGVGIWRKRTCEGRGNVAGERDHGGVGSRYKVDGSENMDD